MNYLVRIDGGWRRVKAQDVKMEWVDDGSSVPPIMRGRVTPIVRGTARHVGLRSPSNSDTWRPPPHWPNITREQWERFQERGRADREELRLLMFKYGTSESDLAPTERPWWKRWLR